VQWTDESGLVVPRRGPDHRAVLGFPLPHLVTGLYAFRMDGERPGPLWSLPPQQFAYRRLMYLVVIQSVSTAVSGSRLRWRRVERNGSLRPHKGAEATLGRPHPAGARLSAARAVRGLPEARAPRRLPAARAPRRLPAARTARNSAVVLKGQ
jgi:hypothetical protein